MYIPGLEFIAIHLGGRLAATLYVQIRAQSPSSIVKRSDELLAIVKTEKTRIESLDVLTAGELSLLGLHIAV